MRNDIRFALRMIASHAWVSAAIVATLALGIGINTTVFTLVNAVLFKPLPLPNGSRLVVVNGKNLREGNRTMFLSYPDFREFQANKGSLEYLEGMIPGQAILSEKGNPPARYRNARVTRGLFEMVRTTPALGRAFTAADEKAGAEPVAIISHRLWLNRYGGSKDILGRVIRVTGQPVTIVGVMPEGFNFPNNQDLWMPLVPADSLQTRTTQPVQAYGVLSSEATVARAESDLSVIAAHLATTYSDTNKDMGASVRTFHQAFNGGNIRTLFLMMLGAVGFVLVIVCANVANMMLSRSITRHREISVRSALGASRWQLVRQLLVESVILSVMGGILGLGLSRIGVHYFDLATADVRPHWIEFGMDYVALGYFSGISILSGILFGLMPALRATRVDLALDLKERTRTIGGPRGGRITAVLVVLQFALTLVLLSGAGLMVRSFFNAQSINEFIPAGEILTASISLPDGAGETYADPGSRVRFFEELQRRLATMPGVTHAVLTNALPGTGSPSRRIEIEGRAAVDASQAPRASFVVHTPGYSALTLLPIQTGRDFNELDGETGREASLVTREFADLHWPGQQALAKRFRFLNDNKPGPWITVIGVTGNLRQNPQDTEANPVVFLPYRQERGGFMAVMLRSATQSPTNLAAPLQTLVQSIDQDLPVFEIRPLDGALERWRWFLRVFGALFLCFASIGLLIASVGIYAVGAQAAASRTREVGIRIALGATPREIVQTMLFRNVVQLAIGVLLGLAGGLAATRFLSNVLIQVSPQDPLAFTAVTAVLFAIGLFACWLPARRAAEMHPVDALRDQ